MCLALPMRITAVDGQLATIAAEDFEQQCSLVLLPEADIGDYVLVHAGYAISRIDEDEARETYELLAEIGLAEMGLSEIEANRPGNVPDADHADRGGGSLPEGGARSEGQDDGDD